MGAKCHGANFNNVKFSYADLSSADLSSAQFSKADFTGAVLRNANLSNAHLGWALLSHTDLSEADLTGSSIYGISVWDVNLEGAKQSNLDIYNSWSPFAPKITVDNLEVAQFIYLLLNNQKLRQVIDSITSKVVLILGRFSDERKKSWML